LFAPSNFEYFKFAGICLIWITYIIYIFFKTEFHISAYPKEIYTRCSYIVVLHQDLCLRDAYSQDGLFRAADWCAEGSSLQNPEAASPVDSSLSKSKSDVSHHRMNHNILIDRLYDAFGGRRSLATKFQNAVFHGKVIVNYFIPIQNIRINSY
jgi:hypothetical protein